MTVIVAFKARLVGLELGDSFDLLLMAASHVTGLSAAFNRAAAGVNVPQTLLSDVLQEQFSEVLDAMFEVLVKPQEHIIDQGADGDNFYVIEK